jgi:hypothetical protein
MAASSLATLKTLAKKKKKKKKIAKNGAARGVAASRPRNRAKISQRIISRRHIMYLNESVSISVSSARNRNEGILVMKNSNDNRNIWQ